MTQSRAQHHSIPQKDSCLESRDRNKYGARMRHQSVGYSDILLSLHECTKGALVRLSSSYNHLINQFSSERNSVLQVGLEM